MNGSKVGADPGPSRGADARRGWRLTTSLLCAFGVTGFGRRPCWMLGVEATMGALWSAEASTLRLRQFGALGGEPLPGARPRSALFSPSRLEYSPREHRKNRTPTGSRVRVGFPGDPDGGNLKALRCRRTAWGGAV